MTIVPATPGFFVATLAAGNSFRLDPVIAWRVDQEGAAVVPITHEGLQHLAGKFLRLPDGRFDQAGVRFANSRDALVHCRSIIEEKAIRDKFRDRHR